MTDFPKTIGDVNEGWLSSLLGATVESYNVRFLEGGVLSDAFLVNGIRYSDGEGPASLVLKLANAVDERREIAVMNNSYMKEVFFFQHLADEMPLQTPEIYGIEDDGKEKIEYFVIAMEDLTTHSLVFDQVEDPPDDAFTRKINLEVAEMHAKYWQADILTEGWLAMPDNRYVFGLEAVCRECPEIKDSYRTLWSEQFGTDPFAGDFEDVGKLTDLVAGPKADQLIDYMNDMLSSRPMTLTHGDLRADNIFRTHPSKGLSVEDSTLTYIDWQIIQPGPVGPEFSQSWQNTLPPEQRRNDLDYLKQYHDRLLELQPAAAEYTFDMLIEDYKIGFIYWWMALLTIGVANLPGFSTPEGQRNRRLWETGMYKNKYALLDHDVLDLVQRYLAEIG